MGTKPELKEVNFENSIKQVIKPGDEVIVVTSGYNHRVNIKAGVYLGKKNDGVSCRVTEYRNDYRNKETGEQIDWSEYYKLYPRYPSGVRYGTPEHTELHTKYSNYIKELQSRFETVKVPYHRHTTLQLNRIFKIDTSAVDLDI